MALRAGTPLRARQAQEGGTMEPQDKSTGTRDEHYNLVSVLYHALQDAENCDTYALDALEAGRDDLATFFREAQVEQIARARRTKELLGIRSISTPQTAEVGTEIPPEGMVGPEAPSTPSDIQRGTSPEPPRTPPPKTKTEPPPPGPRRVLTHLHRGF